MDDGLPAALTQQRSSTWLDRITYSKHGAMVGLEFWVRFRRPIYAYESIPSLTWSVIKVTPNEKLKGDIVELRGRIRGQNGQTALGAKGRVLVTDRL